MPAAKGFNMIYYVEDDDNIRDLTVYALRKQGIEPRAFRATVSLRLLWRDGYPMPSCSTSCCPIPMAWRLCVDCVPIA